MRRITLWLASTISALFLLFSYHTSTNAAATTSIVAPQTDAATAAGAAGTPSTTSGSSPSDSSTTSGSTTSGSTTSGSATSGSATSGASAGSSAAAITPATVDGSVISTRYGNVQVQITVADGKVTAAKVLQVPWSDRKDQQINSRAVPILNSEAVAAQSSDIDMVSGATYTSQAYAQSLQAALDAAHV